MNIITSLNGLSGFRCVVADPPWQLTRPGGWHTLKNHRPLEYPTMTIADISRLPVLSCVEPVAWLFLWTVNAHVEDAYDVTRAWGFRPVTLLTWCKKPKGIGPGGMFSTTTEFVLYSRRGSCKAGREKAEGSSWFEWPRTSRHSEKPKEFFEMVERHFEGPRLELFARHVRPGWTCIGNEVP